MYSVILADPPWLYNRRANRNTRFRGGADAHYPMMSTAEIAALPVADLAAPDAVLFLWATFPRLQESLDVIKGWGFTYKTIGFTWCKLNTVSGTPFFGVGYYSKSNAEPCLLATRGKTLKPAVDTVSSLILSPRMEHSRKPDEVHHRIEQMYPDARKIELFARRQHPGWDVWGNQVQNSVNF